ncbi:hypothetical protein F5Y11DRAFT_337392 [Daldinia sp. FL1419]|nr:hypothetical protein F5Y11DRAFT_337392 [Daldinia sp. FL1419]
MAEKQVEGVIDTHLQVPPPVRTAPQPDQTTNEDQQDAIRASTQPSIPQIIVEEPSKPPNMAIRDNRQPQIVHEKDPEMVMPLDRLTGSPEWIDCPACKQRTRTVATREGGGMEFLVGGLLCCICPCLACLPCIGGWFENTRVDCSVCKATVANIDHDGRTHVVPRYTRAAQQPSVYYQSNSGA